MRMDKESNKITQKRQTGLKRRQNKEMPMRKICYIY